MKRGNTTRSTFSYSSKRKGANLRHTNSTPICLTKCQIVEEKTVMRAKEATQSPGKRNIAEGCSRTLVGRAAVMLLIPEPAGALANNREWSAWGMGGGLRWGGGMATAQSSTITNGMLAVD